MAATAKDIRDERITALFAAGNVHAASWQRLEQCCHSSRCGRICRRLVKGPGIDAVACVDPATGEQTKLYEALADPAFRCPEGRF